jgi:hypothetical protein
MLGSARRWLNGQKLLNKTEFYTPWGVCDLVGVSLSKARVQQRLDLRQRAALGPPRRIALLNLIPDFESDILATASLLATKLQYVFPECELRRHLDRLVEGGFVRRVGPESFQKLNGWAPLHDRIVALELKLRRVEEALFQAVSHLKFATESYVGLPEMVAVRVFHGRGIQRFERAGVGLLAIGTTRCRVLLRSQGTALQPDPVLQMHCVERFWRSHIIGNSP